MIAIKKEPFPIAERVEKYVFDVDYWHGKWDFSTHGEVEEYTAKEALCLYRLYKSLDHPTNRDTLSGEALEAAKKYLLAIMDSDWDVDKKELSEAIRKNNSRFILDFLVETDVLSSDLANYFAFAAVTIKRVIYISKSGSRHDVLIDEKPPEEEKDLFDYLDMGEPKA